MTPPRKRAHPLRWLLEPLEEQAGFLARPMFGCLAAYYEGRLALVLAHGKEPWHGVLVATDRERHGALRARWPELRPHPVLGKWLYLPQRAEEFESTAARLVEAVLARDPLIGVAPSARARHKRGKQ